MKKAIILLLTMMILSLTACGVEQTKTTVTLEAGSTFEFEPTEYFTFDEEVNLEDWTVDTSLLDTSKIGTYDVGITYKNKDYIITAEVVDTKAPSMNMLKRFIFTNDVEHVDITTMMEFFDATKGTVELSRFTKLDELRTLDEEDVNEYLKDIVEKQDIEALVAIEDMEADGEGIYSAVLSITDEAGNMSAEEIVVVYDTTAPEGSFKDVTVYQEDVTIEPEITLSGKIKDNVDGTIDKEDMELTMEKKADAENEYLVKAKATDRAGNVLEGEYTIKVVEGKPASNKDNGSTASNSGSGNGSGSGSGTGGSGNPNLPYSEGSSGTEVINGFTVNFDDVTLGEEVLVRQLCAAGYYNVVDYATGGCGVLVPSEAEIGYGTELLRAHIASLGYEMGFTVASGLYGTSNTWWVTCTDYKTPWVPPANDDMMPGNSGMPDDVGDEFFEID